MSVCECLCMCVCVCICLLWLWSCNQVSTVRGKSLAEIRSSMKRIHLSWTFLSISHHSWYNTWHLEGAQSVIVSCLRGHRVALFRLWLHCMIHCLSRIEEIKSYSKSLQCYGLETEVRIWYFQNSESFVKAYFCSWLYVQLSITIIHISGSILYSLQQMMGAHCLKSKTVALTAMADGS